MTNWQWLNSIYIGCNFFRCNHNSVHSLFFFFIFIIRGEGTEMVFNSSSSCPCSCSLAWGASRREVVESSSSLCCCWGNSWGFWASCSCLCSAMVCSSAWDSLREVAVFRKCMPSCSAMVLSSFTSSPETFVLSFFSFPWVFSSSKTSRNGRLDGDLAVA